MMFETAADGSLADQVITGQNQKAVTGQTTQVMLYDTAGNELLTSSVTVTLQAGSIPTELAATATYTDTDNNANQLGGPVTWTAALMKAILHTMAYSSLMLTTQEVIRLEQM